jgi:medium-chain acyl-[acyl-carrier-protein] hydrolase
MDRHATSQSAPSSGSRKSDLNAVGTKLAGSGVGSMGRTEPQKGRLRLFCFPHAGSGTSIYRGWAGTIAQAIEIWPVALPGREHRLAEPPIDDVQRLAAVVGEELGRFLDPPFALFGHSMGALLAFEVAHHFRRQGRSGPGCLVVSAHRAPHIPDEQDQIHDKPTSEFLQELRQLNGTSAEVLGDRELVELMLPVLRADFKAAELYRYIEGPPLQCPIVAYGGTRDSMVSEAQLAGWRAHTNGGFAQKMFEGDHFYIHTKREEVVAQLASDLQRSCIR